MDTILLCGGHMDDAFVLGCIENIGPDCIIGIDRGLEFCYRNRIVPQYILGDFDSISPEVINWYRSRKEIPIREYKPEKDATDTRMGMELAMELGSDRIFLFGATGGRLDHTVANLQLLYHYNKYFSSLTMLDGMNRCFILDSEKDGAISIPREEGSYLSVFSLSERSHGVTIEGAKYEISDHTLSRDFPLGVSNEFKEKNTVISVNDGILLIVISKMD